MAQSKFARFGAWRAVNYGLAIVLIVYFVLSLFRLDEANLTSTVPGKLQLSAHQTGVYNLRGPWQFYPKQFIVTQPATTQIDPLSANVPASWTKLSSHGQTIPQYSYGSYRVVVTVPDISKQYALKFMNIRSASRVYVNGKLLASHGDPNINRARTTEVNKPFIITFTSQSNQIEIIVEVANYTIKTSGLVGDVWFGESSQVLAYDARHKVFDAMLASGFIFLSFLFIPQLLRRVQQVNYKRHLTYFTLMCFMAAGVSMTVSEKLIYTLIPNLSLEHFLGIQNVLLYGILYLFFLYAMEVLQVKDRKWTAPAAHAIYIIEVIIIYTVPFHVQSEWPPLYLILLLVVFGNVVIRTIQSPIVRQWKDGLWELGLVAFTLYLLNGIYSQVFSRGSASTMALFLLVFVVAQVLLWNRQFYELYREKLTLTKNLSETNASMKQMLDQLMTSELAFLRAQIKPHFLFNAINSIISVSIKQPKQARELLFKLAEYLHYQFDFDKDVAMVAFEKELSSIDAYLALEKVRFKERLHVVVEAPFVAFQIPPLLIQPLVENAIRHGIMVRQEGGTVAVRVARIADEVEIVVEDDGVGMPAHLREQLKAAAAANESTRRVGVGLPNIVERLRKQFGTTLVVEQPPAGGTRIRVRIPIREEQSHESSRRG